MAGWAWKDPRRPRSVGSSPKEPTTTGLRPRPGITFSKWSATRPTDVPAGISKPTAGSKARAAGPRADVPAALGAAAVDAGGHDHRAAVSVGVERLQRVGREPAARGPTGRPLPRQLAGHPSRAAMPPGHAHRAIGIALPVATRGIKPSSYSPDTVLPRFPPLVRPAGSRSRSNPTRRWADRGRPDRGLRGLGTTPRGVQRLAPLVPLACHGAAARDDLVGMTDGSPMPVYEDRCRACGAVEEHLQPMGSDAPGPCEACGGELRRRFSRVGVRYQGWGFQSTDALVPDDRPAMASFEVGQAAARPPQAPTAPAAGLRPGGWTGAPCRASRPCTVPSLSTRQGRSLRRLYGWLAS
jgi:putative FmdB family regulatory protein